MGLAKHAHSTSTSLQYLYDISWKQFWMKLIFWMQVNIIFDRCGQAFSKNLQVPINDIIDCRDFWYMHRPTKGNSLLHILINKWLLSFESWTQRFDRGSINDIHLLCLLKLFSRLVFTCSKSVVKTTGQRRSGVIVIIIIFEKKLKLSFGVSIVVFGQVND